MSYHKKWENLGLLPKCSYTPSPLFDNPKSKKIWKDAKWFFATSTQNSGNGNHPPPPPPPPPPIGKSPKFIIFFRQLARKWKYFLSFILKWKWSEMPSPFMGHVLRISWGICYLEKSWLFSIKIWDSGWPPLTTPFGKKPQIWLLFLQDRTH